MTLMYRSAMAGAWAVAVSIALTGIARALPAFAVCALLVGSTAAAYASVVYDFTFPNVDNGGGTVNGTITLPSSGDGTYAASSVVVTSNTAGFGLGEYVGNPMSNSFFVSGGEITQGFFLDFGVSNSPPAVVCCGLVFVNGQDGGGLRGGLTNSANTINGVGPEDIGIFTLQATPLPSALPLFANGLGALGLLGWRRKKKSAALAA